MAAHIIEKVEQACPILIAFEAFSHSKVVQNVKLLIFMTILISNVFFSTKLDDFSLIL